MTTVLVGKKKKVIFFIPNSRWLGKSLQISVPWGVAIVSAILKDTYDLEVLDANGGNLDERQCQTHIKSKHPDVILMSGTTSVGYAAQVHLGMAMAKSAWSQAITVLGGVYPTVMPDVAIQDDHIDFIFIGHAEGRVEEFLKKVIENDRKALDVMPGIGFKNLKEGGFRINPVTSFIGDVEKLVQPDYTRMDLTPYLDHGFSLDSSTAPLQTISVPVVTSYGCPYNCNFCAVRTISGRGVAFRPMEDVFEEMDYFVKKYKVNAFFFQDDNLLLKRWRMEALCAAFLSGRWGNLPWRTAGLSPWLLDDEILTLMKKAGCTKIRIAVESGSPRVLKDVIHKPLKLEVVPGIVSKCKELGILIRAQFVIGLPGETWEEIRQTFQFADACDFDLAHFSIATPFPGTDMYETAKQMGALPPNFSFSEANYQGQGYSHGFMSTDEFSPQELKILRTFEWDRINFKTKEKTEKIAKMYNMTVQQLNEHRKRTRIGCVTELNLP